MPLWGRKKASEDPAERETRDEEYESDRVVTAEIVSIPRSAPAPAPPVPRFSAIGARPIAQVVERLDFPQRMDGYLANLDSVFIAEAWLQHPKHRRWLTRNYERFLRMISPIVAEVTHSGDPAGLWHAYKSKYGALPLMSEERMEEAEVAAHDAIAKLGMGPTPRPTLIASDLDPKEVFARYAVARAKREKGETLTPAPSEDSEAE